MKADEELLEQRLLSRQTCLTCFHDYIFEPVVNEGVCNLCGGELYKRSTDNRKMIRERIALFNSTTMKIVQILNKEREMYTIDANMDIHEVYKEILNVVSEQ